jgi:DMSO/TMAO reductase YedYZ molybdopterin-dependent catalytic subunit
VVTITGLLSWIAYGPQFNQANPDVVGFLHLPIFDWPTSPSWLYRLTQGVHVILGLVLIPVVLAKLWSVAPKLLVWPPARSIAQVLERLSLIALVGGIIFEIVTGVANIQYDYLFGFSFYTAHYYGAWVFIAGFVVHVALKFPRMLSALRSRSLRTELRTPLAQTVPEPVDPDGLVAIDPAEPTPVEARRSCARGRGSGARIRLDSGSVHWRIHAPGGLAAAARALLWRRPQRLPGEPHRQGRRDQGRGHWPKLAADHRQRATVDVL